jgi:hypothetical protein
VGVVVLFREKMGGVKLELGKRLSGSVLCNPFPVLEEVGVRGVLEEVVLAPFSVTR